MQLLNEIVREITRLYSLDLSHAGKKDTYLNIQIKKRCKKLDEIMILVCTETIGSD